MATAALLAVTVIWGSTFFVIKDAVDAMDPADFLAVRFTLAAVVICAVLWRRIARLSPKHWAFALGVGAVYGLGQLAQTYGLRLTSASMSGFITGTYVVITPLVVWAVFRRRPSVRTWVAVLVAVVGLGVLSITGTSIGGPGEALTLLGAALYAVHIVALDRAARRVDVLALTAVQMVGIALVVGIAGLPGGYTVPAAPSVLGAIAYTALVAGVLTMGLQTWSQQYLAPTRVALLMTLEPVFATLFAVVFGGESVTLRLLIGGLMILAGTVIGVRADPAPDAPLTTAGPNPEPIHVQ
ncbi:DMT family transporter [Tessaracoccus sp. OS52]|uniref:DMT family transporter n=1 Tax=Tessaracoccus sp. OS52 TaxID=2886691 RepID=UPI001D11D2B4|nr:DMT family transporter [Tessaracoccus sp. OS52]MCC2591883.1 DMT family transporter [Tessaracoccus sp. OS52]